MPSLLEQYFKVKEKYKGCLIFFRLGEFYELFFEDAVTASSELGIKLTSRESKQGERSPMCGVPYHAAENHITKLVEKGYKVAICEQMEAPNKDKGSKKIVEREVIKVITPGTNTYAKAFDSTENNYITCIFKDNSGFGIATCDVTTGEFTTTCFDSSQTEQSKQSKKVIEEIFRICPKEIITNDLFKSKELKSVVYYTTAFNLKEATKIICGHLKIDNLKSLEIYKNPHCICACGALIDYLYEMQKNSISHINSIKYYANSLYVIPNASSLKNLELTQSLHEKGNKNSLLWVLDETKTSMGKRLIKKWIEQPLNCHIEINRRLNAVSELFENGLLRFELRESLNLVSDIERLCGKIIYKAISSKDLIDLKLAIEQLPTIKRCIEKLSSKLCIEMYNAFDELFDIYALLEEAINENCTASLEEGGIIKDGYDKTLDKYREIKAKGETLLSELENKEKLNSGIKSLKIKYGKALGYYFEVTNSYLEKVPNYFKKRQVNSNGQRFTTDELEQIAFEILQANEEIDLIEKEIFKEVINDIKSQTERMQLSASIIATIDVLQSFAEVSNKNKYVKPIVNDKSVIDIEEARHPVIEKLTSFVPNNIFLDKDSNRLLIITGPNMAGKSTYIRQTALIVIMAQIGCFIPAKSGIIGVVDKIFTRIGASDDLSTGRSTFMVEMSEVAEILNGATKNSLLVLDEIGRGTSTVDGLSIAFAVLEEIALKIGAKTLFSTHYHKLAELETKVLGVKNYYMAVEEINGEIAFLRKLVEGKADSSFGIHVAKLAGISKPILERAEQILQIINNSYYSKVEILPFEQVEQDSYNYYNISLDEG